MMLRAKSGLPKPDRHGIQYKRPMLNLSASQAAKKAFAELIEAIAAALDLTTGQSQFLLTLSGALLAFFVFYHLRCYVRAAPELPAKETFHAPGEPTTSRRRLYAVLGLVAGGLCIILGYTFGSHDSSLATLGWLLIPASLLAMGIISLLDGRHKNDESAESPTEDPPDPLGTYAFVSFFAAIFVLPLGLECLNHAEKSERMRAAEEARKVPGRLRSFLPQATPSPSGPSSQKEPTWEDFDKSLEEWRQMRASKQPSGKSGGEGPKSEAATKDSSPEKPGAK